MTANPAPENQSAAASTQDGSGLSVASGSPLRFPDIGDRYEKRTQHWIIEREVTGLNGLGLPWLRETWRWPSGGTCRENILTLGIEDTLKMLEEFTLLPANVGVSDAVRKDSDAK